MKASTLQDYQSRVERVLLWLEEHKSEPITPAEAASVAHFSQHHFHRVFRGMTGESLMECHRRLRLESAALRIRRSDVTATEAAFEAGFDSHEGFTRAFKAHFGTPPSVWRRLESARLRGAGQWEPIDAAMVEIRTTKPQSFVCMRHRGSFEEVGEVWGRLMAIAFGTGLYTGSQQLAGSYPDDPDVTPAGMVRYDVGWIDTSNRQVPAPLRRETVPGGRWAIAVHKGSYATLSETYLRLVGGYFPRSGLELADRPCMEFYLNNPANTAEPDLLTEVWAPVEG